MDLRQYLADKYSVEELKKKQDEANYQNSLQGLMAGVNKTLGGDGSVMQGAMASNNAGIKQYEGQWNAAKEVDKETGRRADEVAASDPNDPRAVLRRNLAKKYGIDLGSDVGLKAINAADKDIDRVLSGREKAEQRQYGLELGRIQNAGKGKNAEKEVEPTALKEYRKKLGGEIATWKASGQNISQSNLAKLDDVLGRIESGEIQVNSALGFLPMWARNVVDQDGVAAQQRVEAVVQQSLKAILGAQFAQKEAEQLFARTWNPRAPIQENLARVDLLKKELESGQANKNELLNRLETTGDVLGGGEAPQQPQDRTVVKKQYSPSRNQTRIIYSDGSQEILDGQQ